ncbi:MAG: hypothetical protein LBD87_02360 [Prevotellaceae bacterium]|jgi:hypothetical protein|nr:hypothetical protein [Prevotellaceae bacterium]
MTGQPQDIQWKQRFSNQRGLDDGGHDWMGRINSRINAIHTYSDATIDLTMRGGRLGGTVSASIAQALDDLPLPCMIDRYIYDQLSNPGLMEHINRAGKLFYKK